VHLYVESTRPPAEHLNGSRAEEGCSRERFASEELTEDALLTDFAVLTRPAL
jgi:hypothetical protein